MPKQAAQEAYQERQSDIGALLDLMGPEIKAHGEFGEKEGLDWGHVGDLGHVRKCLIETLTFLAQQDEEFIENHLAELRTEGSTKL